MDALQAWPRCPEAAAWFEARFHSFAAANPPVEEMALRFRETAGVDIRALIDHWVLPETPGLRDELTALGLAENRNAEGDTVWKHPGARLPGVRIKSKRNTPLLALRVEDIDAFARANHLTLTGLHGDPDARYQCGHVALPQGELMPIARRGYDGFAPGTFLPDEAQLLLRGQSAFLNRWRGEREDDSEADVIAEAGTAFSLAAERLGRDRAVDEFFAAERDYYRTRNAAARYQYAQQQAIGIGWANHDHHTYRSSRASFRALMQLFLAMGFEFRERFYAGAEAGWGAQILEHPVSRVVIFADVDMAPEELDIDFARELLPPRDTLGTIGLWCALHGVCISAAGLHHLECEFDFVHAQANLEAAGHAVMASFTDLPMLRQAFTVAETWPVAPERLTAIRGAGQITAAQAERFAVQGAAGSHLEILQRWEGFKGFNKTGISRIIQTTDARNAEEVA